MKLRISATVVLCLALFSLQSTYAQGSKSGKVISNLRLTGTTSLSTTGSGTSTAVGMEIRKGPEPDEGFEKQIKGTIAPARVRAAQVPRPVGSTVQAPGPEFSGFNGLTHLDQRLAGTGIYTNTQFTSEPPDNTMAVSDSHIVEAVNTAIVVRDKTGAVVAGPIPANQFYNLTPAFDRVTGLSGDFMTDPKVYFDVDTQRWFITYLQIDVDPVTGGLLSGSHVEIAVSKSSDPTGAWYLYALDVTDDGTDGTPSHPDCPCFGDQPLIGADTNGFYVTTNEFSIFEDGFNGAQVYAFSKQALINGTLPAVVHFDNLPLAEGIAYTLQPAMVPAGGNHTPDVEYFLSALEFTGTVDNRIAAWALTGTASLASATPKLTLTSFVMDSQVYGQPPDAQQKAGPTPLKDALKDAATAAALGGKPTQEHLSLIAANDDRMQQVVFADGKLWSALSTSVKTANGPSHAGIAYFVVAPSWNGTAFSASVVKQGYLSVNQNNLIFPAVGVNAQGKGAITFTLVGPSYYPTAAYALLDATHGAGPVKIASAGAAPADGFTGYGFFDGRSNRWGDYSSATADSSGVIWLITEYIPDAPRSLLANWGGFITKVTP